MRSTRTEPLVWMGVNPLAEAGVYVVLGNCLAAGAEGKTLTTPYPFFYQQFLEKQLQTPLRIYDFSRIYGMSTEELLQLLEQDDQVRHLLRRSQAVTFNIGENELMQAEVASSRGNRDALSQAWRSFRRTYPQVVNCILDLVPLRQAIIRTFTMYNPVPQHPQAHYVQRFNSVILGAAERGRNARHRRIPTAHLEHQFAGRNLRRLVGSDGMHPSAEGHRQIARQLADLGTRTV